MDDLIRVLLSSAGTGGAIVIGLIVLRFFSNRNGGVKVQQDPAVRAALDDLMETVREMRTSIALMNQAIELHNEELIRRLEELHRQPPVASPGLRPGPH